MSNENDTYRNMFTEKVTGKVGKTFNCLSNCLKNCLIVFIRENNRHGCDKSNRHTQTHTRTERFFPSMHY